MTVFMAIDQFTGLTLPDGQIAGLAKTRAGLRTAGFDSGTYAGNRIGSIDETDSSVFDNDVTPGWFFIGGETVSALPNSELDDLRIAIKMWQLQVVAWAEELIARGVAQTPAKVEEGQERLRSACGYVWLVCRDSSHSLANRKILVSNMTTGAQDIRKVDDFYSTATQPFPPNDGASSQNVFGTNSRWYSWVSISAPGTKLDLDSSAHVEGTVPAGTLLLDSEWVDNIAS